MEPSIRPIFHPRFDRQGGMHGAVVLATGRFIEYGGPQNRPADLGHDLQTELVEFGTTTGLNIAQVQIKGQNPWTLLSITWIVSDLTQAQGGKRKVSTPWEFCKATTPRSTHRRTW